MNLFTKETIINKKIPKRRFYENIDVSTKVKSKFVNIIESIVLENKLSEDTIHISKTDEVEEILVFKIILKENCNYDELDEILYVIDKSIPYPIVFLIPFNEKVVCKIARKYRNKIHIDKSVVDVYLTREVDNVEDFKEEISSIYNSLNLKRVYEKLLKIILLMSDDSRDIDTLIELYKKDRALKSQIQILEKKVISERQSDKQFELHKELVDKQNELKELWE